MAKELNLTAKDIYDKEFHVDVRGFSCEEVDEFLDQIIEDYQTYDMESCDDDILQQCYVIMLSSQHHYIQLVQLSHYVD